MAAGLGETVAVNGLFGVLNGEVPDTSQRAVEQEAKARREKVVRNLLPPVIAMAARSGYPDVVAGIISDITGIRPNEVQTGLEGMLDDGSVRLLTDEDGGWSGKLIVCADDSRAAAYAPFIDIDGQLVPRIELAETVQAVAQAHQAAVNFRRTYGQTIPAAPPLEVVPQIHQE